ncbi:TPA: DUF3265 domain-containing protein [Vibrio parahaemolyticus]|nr:DUF3265 domain-containing protein [Vibrio parahaemolyticus]
MDNTPFAVKDIANKRLKTDSQRVAFLPCVGFCDLSGVRKHRIALLTT